MKSRFSVRDACSWALSVGVAYAIGRHLAATHVGIAFADNTLLTIAMITREALRVLENNLVFTKNVNRQLTFASSCPA